MPAARRPAPPEVMLDLIFGYAISQLIYTAAKLGIADLLAERPMTAAAIAKKVGADPSHLYRALRALASVGVFAEDAKGRFKLTPLAATLRSDHPASMKDFALMQPDDYIWNAWGALSETVVKGGIAFDRVYNMPVFAYIAAHPDKERAFAAAMASVSSAQTAAVAKAIPVKDIKHLVDIGGAHGHLLSAVLRRHKKLKGTLFDAPPVVAEAPHSGFVSAPDIEPRCDLAAGDFFESVPKGADGYLMKYIIHDWDDEKCVKILSNCRKAMTKDGRVFIVDYVLPKGNGKHFGKLMDINMMCCPGGRERTKDEFAALLKRARLKLKRVIPTECPLSIVEAVRA